MVQGGDLGWLALLKSGIAGQFWSLSLFISEACLVPPSDRDMMLVRYHGFTGDPFFHTTFLLPI